jgi:hypothetical protein
MARQLERAGGARGGGGGVGGLLASDPVELSVTEGGNVLVKKMKLMKIRMNFANWTQQELAMVTCGVGEEVL